MDFSIIGNCPIFASIGNSVVASPFFITSISRYNGAEYDKLRSLASLGNNFSIAPSASFTIGFSTLIFPNFKYVPLISVSIIFCSFTIFCNPTSKNLLNESI